MLRASTFRIRRPTACQSSGLEYAGDFDDVFLAALRHMAEVPAAPVEVRLDVGLGAAPCRAGSHRRRSRSPARGSRRTNDAKHVPSVLPDMTKNS